MKRRGISNSQNYGPDFENWEIGTATNVVRRFQEEYGFLRGDEEFEDLRQVCLLHWFRNRNKYDKSKGANPRTYMARVIENKLLDIVDKRITDKRKSNNNSLSLNTPTFRDDDDSPELIEIIEQDGMVNKDFSEHEMTELRIVISQAIDRLDPLDRKVCELLSQGYTKVDIADIIREPRTTLNDRIKRLKKIFTQEGLKDFLK